jgi:3-phosphoshikimate 1-carboxyvinyltransferase
MAPTGAVTEIDVPLLNEKPYVEITLSYLNAQRIPYETNAGFSYFRIPGGAAWQPMNGPVSGDFSSAAFPACAAAVTGGPVTILGLDPNDTQCDKAIFTMLEQMGCAITWGEGVTVGRSGPLRGGTFDLNATPDLLPVMAITAAFAQGDTALINVAHARIKETDRIAAMAEELAKLGVACTEKPDALIIHGRGASVERRSPGTVLDGRSDHRIVMSLAVAALAAGPFAIDSAEAADVTYPGFLELLKADIL